MNNDAQRIQFQEGSVTLPAGFEDRTTNLFVPADTATQPNLSIARDWLNEGEVLSAYVDRQLQQFKARMAGHRLLSRQAEQLGPEGAVLEGERIDARFVSSNRTVYQRQAAFIVAPGRAIIFTASSPHAFHPEFEAFWRQWLESYRAPGEVGHAPDSGPGSDPDSERRGAPRSAPPGTADD